MSDKLLPNPIERLSLFRMRAAFALTGVMLLLFRPFRVGDTIRVGTNIDTVKENTIYHPTRRIEIAVGFPPKVDLDRVEDSFRRAIAGTKGILREPRPDLFVLDISGATPPGGALPPPGTVSRHLRAWCNTPDYNVVRQKVARLAKKVLDETRS